jgi:hypothetical protein
MLACPKCGEDNPLGFVFCRKCGVKLELSAVTSQRVESAHRPSWLRRHGPEIVGLSIGALVLVGVLAVWPQSAPPGGKGTALGARRVEGRLAAFAQVKQGESTGADPAFVESDVNGYFEYLMARPLNLLSGSVAVRPDRLRLRIVRVPLAFDLRNVRFSPKLSLDLVCGVEAGRLKTRCGWVGHLPLPGPLGVPVERVFLRLFASQSLWSCLRDAEDVRLQEGAVSVMIRR